ncbi:hypothetical protein DFH08DRAFT_822501 [Mycena albidolilacea]|uniref:Uncharacterized protein n=1 Tax=Mycena albidolilacea TaxID=1033008 RepID=A0AAD6Z8A5_9AGAR|nr:hypothetical protein DFH08DRAFT_822501 [Mycena albidolilacea]
MARHHKYFEGGAVEVSTRKPNGSASRILESGESTCGLSSRPFLQPLGSKVAHNPELLAFVESNTHSSRWIGAKRHVIAYPILRNPICNISTTQSDINFAAEPTATWTTRAGKSAMLKVYSDFCPLVVRMLELVPKGERLRKARTKHLVEEVAASECALHPMDPEVQAARGEAFCQVKYGSLDCVRVVNREVQDFVYGHDCVRDAEVHFDGYFAEVKGK